MILLRGIGCNWLVCLACFFGIQGRDLASKVIGIWLPTFAFVSLGFDHVVANMTFIPLGIWLGAPHITIGLYIWKGIIPTLLGNIIGGGIFCGQYCHPYSQIRPLKLMKTLGTYYWYMLLLDLNTLPLYGKDRARSSSLKSVSCSDRASTKRSDIESPAGSFGDLNRHINEGILE